MRSAAFCQEQHLSNDAELVLCVDILLARYSLQRPRSALMSCMSVMMGWAIDPFSGDLRCTGCTAPEHSGTIWWNWPVRRMQELLKVRQRLPIIPSPNPFRPGVQRGEGPCPLSWLAGFPAGVWLCCAAPDGGQAFGAGISHCNRLSLLAEESLALNWLQALNSSMHPRLTLLSADTRLAATVQDELGTQDLAFKGRFF